MSLEQVIRIHGKISETDYVRAQWLHLRPRPVSAVLGICFALLLLVGGIAQIAGWLEGVATPSEAAMLPFLASVLLLYFGVLSSWRFKRSYRNYKAIQVPVDITLSETEFRAQSEHGEAHLPWDMFRKY